MLHKPAVYEYDPGCPELPGYSTLNPFPPPPPQAGGAPPPECQWTSCFWDVGGSGHYICVCLDGTGGG